MQLTELTEADPRDLTQQQITAMRDMLLDDLFLFAQVIFGYRDLVAHLHGELADLIRRWGTPGFERLMVMFPREGFKTSLCTRANALWQIANDPDSPVAIFTLREPNAAKWIRAIREVVQSNLLFQVLFADLLPPGIARNDTRSLPRGWKWSDTELLFERGALGIPEASLTGMGIGAAAAGGHWPKIIKDDIIDEDAVKSPTIMEDAREWFDKSLYLERPALQGWDMVVCTHWAYGDVYDHILQKYDYKLYKRSALEEGVSIFPEKWSTEELLLQEQRDPYGFSAQMQNNPKPGKEQAFDTSWLRWGSIREDAFTIDKDDYTKETPHDPGVPPPRHVQLSSMSKVILLDPAPTEETQKRKEPGARNGIVVEGMDCWGRRYILETWAGRIDPLDVIHKLLALCEKWGTDRVGIEEVVFSLIYRHWLQKEARAKGKHVRCIRLQPGRKDKDTRITGQIVPCREGVYHVNRAGGTEPFIQEMMEYPYGRTRDLLDAWSYDGVLTRPESLEEVWEREGQREQNTQDPVTGY
jgi:hypothetical protein